MPAHGSLRVGSGWAMPPPGQNVDQSRSSNRNSCESLLHCIHARRWASSSAPLSSNAQPLHEAKIGKRTRPLISITEPSQSSPGSKMPLPHLSRSETSPREIQEAVSSFALMIPMDDVMKDDDGNATLSYIMWHGGPSTVHT